MAPMLEEIMNCRTPFRSNTHQELYEGMMAIHTARGDNLLQPLPSWLTPLDFVFAPHAWTAAEKEAWKARKEAPKMSDDYRCMLLALFVFTNADHDPEEEPLLSQADCERLEKLPDGAQLFAMTAENARKVKDPNLLSMYMLPKSAVDMAGMRSRGTAEKWPLMLLPGAGRS